MLRRLADLLASLWLGLVLTLGAVAAPAAFAVLERSAAGRVAGQCFRIEAQLSLGLALILLLIHRRLASERSADVRRSAMSAEILLVLGALFCTVLGYFALQPAMEAARAGQGAWSFGAIHGASSALFALKGILLCALAWRATGRSAAC